MPKKFRSKCLRDRQRQLKKVRAGLPNAYQEGLSDRACFSRTGDSPSAYLQAPQRPVPVRVWHAWSERSSQFTFSKSKFTCLGCRCWPRRHLQRGFFFIITQAERRKIFRTCPKYRKTRRRLHGLNPGPSQWKFNHRKVLDSNFQIS